MKKIYSILIALLALVGVVQAQTVVFDIASNPWNLPLGSGQGESASAGDVEKIEQDGVTLTFTSEGEKTTPTRMWTGPQLRMYANNAVTVTAGDQLIESVLFTYTTSNTDKDYFTNDIDETETKSGTAWTGSATSVTFKTATSKGRLQITKIEVTLKNDDPNYVATPKITPATGTYYAAQTVTISAGEGCTIYYTTDGGDPKASDAVYAEPFTVDKTTTVRAIARKGNNESEEASSIITIMTLPSGDGDGSLENPYNYVGATAVASALASGAKSDDVYVKGKVSKITYAFDTQHGTATFFITDDGNEADNQFQVYSTYFLGNRSWKDGDTQIKVGDDVIIYGKLTNYQGTPETAAKESCLYSLNGEKAPDIVYTEYNTLAAVKAAAPADEDHATYAQLNVDNLLVSYVNGKSVYLFDGEDGMLIYGTNSKNLKTGDKISGNIKGKLYKRNGNTQLASTAYEVEVVSSGNDVVPQVVAAADLLANDGAAYENELVSVSYLVAPENPAWTNRSISFDAYADDSYGKSVGIVAAYDNWNVAADLTFNQETPYTLTGFVTVYTKGNTTTVQLYPRTKADIDNGETFTPEGEGTLEKPYTIADVHGLYDAAKASEAVWVKAYIIGSVDREFTEAKLVKEGGENATPSNIVVADAADEAAIAKMIPVALPSGSAVRAALNLKDNAENLGKQVWVYGTIEKYFNVAGVKNVTNYSFDGVTTAVNGITVDAPAAKAIYNIAGQRVQNLSKAGLYIVNGKKVVVK